MPATLAECCEAHRTLWTVLSPRHKRQLLNGTVVMRRCDCAYCRRYARLWHGAQDSVRPAS